MSTTTLTPIPLSPSRKGRRGPWWPWVLFGLVVAAAMGVVISLVQPPRSLKESPVPSVSSNLAWTRLDPVQGDKVLHAVAALRDPTPLFLPTRLNAGYDRLPAQLGHVAGDSFPAFQPQVTFKEREARLSFPDAVTVPESAAGGLRVGEQSNPFRLFGRTDLKLPALPARLGFLEILQASGGVPVIATSIPPMAGVPSAGWLPMELLAAVDSAGLVGGLTVVVGSTVEEWDDFWKDYLESRYRLGARLKPGIYRVRVGP